MASVEANIVEALRDAVNAIDGFKARVGRFDLMDVPEGSVCIRPITMRAPQRSTTDQEYELRALLGVRSKLVGDDDTEGTHAFSKVCDDVKTVLKAMIDSPKFKPGGEGSVAAKIVRGELQYWYRPAAKSGQAGGGILPVTVSWSESV